MCLEDSVLPFKSPVDDRDFRVVNLDNGLQVLLVQDKDTLKSGACLLVGIGWMKDKKDGTAHFLEHVLHLGSNKYKEDNEYKHYLSMHGGKSNASTADELTKFFFQVNSNNLEGALDRFSQLFIFPLLNDESIKREKYAVHNEYLLSLENDGRRNFHLLKELIRSVNHPCSKFSTGNLDTLKTVDKNDLKCFFENFYSASIMKLVVIDNRPIDNLLKIISSQFSSIKNTGIKRLLYKTSPFNNLRGKFIEYITVRDIYRFEILWSVPIIYHLWKYKVLHIISHLIGHEGPGSIISYLKNKGYGNDLSANIKHNKTYSTIFSIKISLNKKGSKNLEKILRIIFYYIKLIKNLDLKDLKKIYKQIVKIKKISFLYKDKNEIINDCKLWAFNLYKYGHKNCLNGPYSLSKFDGCLLNSFLTELSYDRCWIMLGYKNGGDKMDRKEKLYGIEYNIKKINSQLEFDDKYIKELRLPTPNEFIPEIFDMLRNNTKLENVEEIYNDFGIKCWHSCNVSFKLPKIILTMSIESLDMTSTINRYILTRMAILLLNDSLNENIYDAMLVGYKCFLNLSIKGLRLKIKGFSEKFQNYMNFILKIIINFEVYIKKERFEHIKEKFIRDLMNSRIKTPFQQAIAREKEILLSNFYNVNDKINESEGIEFEQVFEHLKLLFKRSDNELKILITGNVNKSQCKLLCADIYKHVYKNKNKLKDKKLLVLRCLKLKKGKLNKFCENSFNNNESNHSYVLVLQMGYNKIEKRCCLYILSRMIRNKFSNFIRTKKSIAYVVKSNIVICRNVLHYRMLIQSSIINPDHLEDKVREFMGMFKNNVLGEEPIDEYKKSIIEGLKEIPKNLNEVHNKYWNEIADERYLFDIDEKEIECIKGVKEKDVINFFFKYMDLGCCGIKSIGIKIFSGKYKIEKKEDRNVIEDIRRFKIISQYYKNTDFSDY